MTAKPKKLHKVVVWAVVDPTGMCWESFLAKWRAQSFIRNSAPLYDKCYIVRCAGEFKP
jgi:hypothetical protein